jgi:ABC-type transporter lipoprotein component MlaA
LQETAKDTLKKLVEEKLDTVKRMSNIERSLSNTEDEYSTLKELYEREVEENRNLAEEIRLVSEAV